MRPCHWIDTTLRDGVQAAGVRFSDSHRLQIARMLDDAGIEWIEAGIPASGPEEQQRFRALIRLRLKARLISWNRLNLQDAETSLRVGADFLHFCVPSSDVQIEKKLLKSRSWILSEMERVLSVMQKEKVVFSVGFEDASRSDREWLKELMTHAADLGAVRVRLADTVGALDPFSTFDLISFLAPHGSLPLEFHAHNDLGLATANTLAAFKAGADYLDVTVNGLGERAGNAALEEVAASITVLQLGDSPLNLKALPKLSQAVSRASGIGLSPQKPITGKRVFSHQSKIHVDGLLKDRKTYEFVNPEIFGRYHRLILKNKKRKEETGTKIAIDQS